MTTTASKTNTELKSMRQGFGAGLLAAGRNNKNVVALCADLSESLSMNDFKKAFPERFLEVGVAEQNLVTIASGMAAMGKIPFVGSYAVFSPGRNWEQIRTTICYNDRPVKIVGSHIGLNVGADGGSHQALEDIALMRSLPNMIVLSPCDALEAEKCVESAIKNEMPTYIRLSREKSPLLTEKIDKFQIGKASVLHRSYGEKMDVAIFGTGSILSEAIKAGHMLESRGIKVTIANISSIKPLDEDFIIRTANETKCIVTVEEHQVAGGMGSAVAEVLASHRPVPIEFVAVKDMFGQSGTPEELYKLYGLTSDHIVAASMRAKLRKF